MFNLQGGELIIIALLALVVLGPEKLPEAARWFGRMYAQVRRMGDGFTKEFQSAVKEPLDDLRSAVSDPVKDLKTSLDETIASSALDSQNGHTTPPETTTTESEETAVASPPPARADDEGLSSS